MPSGGTQLRVKPILRKTFSIREMFLSEKKNSYSLTLTLCLMNRLTLLSRPIIWNQTQMLAMSKDYLLHQRNKDKTRLQGLLFSWWCLQDSKCKGWLSDPPTLRMQKTLISEFNFNFIKSIINEITLLPHQFLNALHWCKNFQYMP